MVPYGNIPDHGSVPPRLNPHRFSPYESDTHGSDHRCSYLTYYDQIIGLTWHKSSITFNVSITLFIFSPWALSINIHIHKY